MDIQVARDSFARTTTYRKVEPSPVSCAQCGNWRKNARNRLYRYGVEPDGLGTSVSWDTKLFCNKACRDAFYGERT